MSKKKTSEFYQDLVPFLIGAYSDVDKIKAQKLGICALDYFHSLLAIDSFIDGEVNVVKQPQRLFEAVEQNATAIKNLAFLIPEKNIFWQQFDEVKRHYAKTVFYEKQLSIECSDIDEALFEKLAFGKSAVCCGIVYGLQALCSEPAPVETLNDIIKDIHIAFQYSDDISDFKTDTQSKQWTYPRFLVKQYIHHNDWPQGDENVAHKCLFLSGIADNLVQKAVFHYQKASIASDALGLVELSHFLKKEQEAVLFYANEIRLLIEKTQIKAQKSQAVVLENQDISKAIERANSYLITNARNGYWEDFMTSAGHGKGWISGFVGLMLAEHQANLPILQTVISNISASGSYNESILQDADSSTFLIGFHEALDSNTTQDLRHSWLAFQQANGGWATYIDEQTLRQTLDLEESIAVDGWLQTHPCVSAAAAYVLRSIPEMKENYDRTCAYLEKRILAQSLISYWWTSDVYTQSFSLLAIANTHRKKICNKLINNIIDFQHEGGYWVNPNSNLPNAFYTALALKAMLCFEPENQRIEIEAAANWLRTNQMTDGSWQTDRILRIPATDVINPATVSQWRQSSFGVNALSDDHNRVFTTSMVVNALNSYQNYDH